LRIAIEIQQNKAGSINTIIQIPQLSLDKIPHINYNKKERMNE